MKKLFSRAILPIFLAALTLCACDPGISASSSDPASSETTVSSAEKSSSADPASSEVTVSSGETPEISVDLALLKSVQNLTDAQTEEFLKTHTDFAFLLAHTYGFIQTGSWLQNAFPDSQMVSAINSRPELLAISSEKATAAFQTDRIRDFFADVKEGKPSALALVRPNALEYYKADITVFTFDGSVLLYRTYCFFDDELTICNEGKTELSEIDRFFVITNRWGAASEELIIPKNGKFEAVTLEIEGKTPEEIAKLLKERTKYDGEVAADTPATFENYGRTFYSFRFAKDLTADQQEELMLCITTDGSEVYWVDDGLGIWRQLVK